MYTCGERDISHAYVIRHVIGEGNGALNLNLPSAWPYCTSASLYLSAVIRDTSTKLTIVYEKMPQVYFHDL
jgi:hypothetical protein